MSQILRLGRRAVPLFEGTDGAADIQSSIRHFGRRELVLLCRLGSQILYPSRPQVRDVTLHACVSLANPDGLEV